MTKEPVHDNTLTRIVVPEVIQTTLPDGSRLFGLESPGKELTRIFIRYDHPALFATRAVEGQILFQLMKSGTLDKPLFRFVTSMEETGMMLSCYTGSNSGTIEMVVLNEQLPAALPLVFEMMSTPALPEDEFARIRNIALENYKISRRQTHVVSREKLMQRLFVNHPYGIIPTMDSVAAITHNDIVQLHHQMVSTIKPTLFVASANPMQVADAIGSVMTRYSLESYGNTTPVNFQPQSENGDSHLPHTVISGAVQSSIRMGRRMFPKGHADYTVGKVATTILGGYFSSRLMANLREDKGYTYGVGAGLMTIPTDGYLSISAEVGSQHLESAVAEICREVDRMRHEPPDAEELQIVKQYLRGNALRKTDGVFNHLSLVASLHREGLPPSWLSQYLKELNKVTPEAVMAFAIRWLNPADLTSVTVGPELEIKKTTIQ